MNTSFNRSKNISNPINSSPSTIISYLFGCEFLIGVILNSITIIVCVKSPLLKKPSFVITSFLALANILLLCLTAFEKFVQFIIPSLVNNLVWCKTNLFFEVFCYNWCAWLLVSNYSITIY